MSLPQPGQVQKFDTGIVLSSSNDSAVTVQSGSRFGYNGSQFYLSQYDFNTHKREMNIWNTDGSPASNFFFSDQYLFDVFYDSHDEVYYGLSWNKEVRGVGTSFSNETEGGGESATTFISDIFSENQDWHIQGVPYVRTYDSIDYNPPSINNIEEVSRRWVGYSQRTYDALTPITSASPSWGIDDNFTLATTASYSLLEVDEGNSRLVYFSNVGTGYLHFDVEVTGNFVAFADLDVTTYEADCVLSFRVLRQGKREQDPYNQLGSITYRGPQSNPRLQCWTVASQNDSAGAYWSLSNLRVSEKYLDSTAAGSVVSVTHNSFETFTVKASEYAYIDYDFGGEDITREHVVGLSLEDSSDTHYAYGAFGSNIRLDKVSSMNGISPGGDRNRVSSWVDNGYKIAGMDVRAGYDLNQSDVVLTDYLDSDVKGSSSDIKVGMYKEVAVPGIDNDKLRIAIKRVGTTIYFMKRDNTVAGGSYTVIHSLDLGYEGPVRFELYGDATAGTAAPEIAVEKVVVRDLFPSEVTGEGQSGGVVWPHPVFTLKSYDVDGFQVEATGMSDAFGSVINSFDIINKGVDAGGDFMDFYGTVQLATNHGPTNASGEVFVNVGTDFYKYLKDTLPISTVEDGSSASVITYSSVFGYPHYNTLDWNMYTQGGLIYVARNAADPGEGLYLNVIRHTTMAPNDPVKFAWIEASDDTYKLYGVDINEPHLLYGLSTTDNKVYIYNLDEDASAFCNVISQKQIVGANTAETSVTTAQVVNIYGDPLELKTVNFSVSSGDGSVSPASDITNSLGEATTTYTVGSTVGTSTIRATVTD